MSQLHSLENGKLCRGRPPPHMSRWDGKCYFSLGIFIILYWLYHGGVLPLLKAVFFFFLRLYLQHMEVPGLGVELERQLPAYATATAMLDLSPICDLCSSLWQQWTLNPLSKVRDRTHILRDNIGSLIHQATTGTPRN